MSHHHQSRSTVKEMSAEENNEKQVNQVPRKRLPVAVFVVMSGMLALALWRGADGAAVAAIGASFVAFLALSDPRVKNLQLGETLKLVFQAQAKAEKVVAEARDLASTQVNLLLESLASAGRIGGTHHEDLRAAAIQLEAKLNALGCSEEEVERGVHPAYKWIRRDRTLGRVQAAIATAAKEAGYPSDPVVTDETGRMWDTDASPDEIASAVKRIDNKLGSQISGDEEFTRALEEHRKLWGERPRPPLQGSS